MTKPTGYVPLVAHHPTNSGLFISVPLEVWGPGHVLLCGSQEFDCEESAYAHALEKVAAAKARTDARHEADKGELLTTLPNGWEVRRKVTSHAINAHDRSSIYVGIFDPGAEDNGPWRAHAHNQWSNRAGAPRWRVNVHKTNWTCNRYITEAGATAAMLRAAGRIHGFQED